MMPGYTYDPAKIVELGKDRMRFELGDTMVEGGAETTALADEEITALLDIYPRSWKRAKLALVESICRRFSYEVDEKIGPLSLGLRARAEAWYAMYEALKKEVRASSAMGMGPDPHTKPPYFYAGMMDNPESSGKTGAGRRVP